ncbi:MAG: OmpH family outer membrane protein [Tannerella sp.]|jgi:outer membrane protein|nr:OmpH family outer membrane protein [Tannerella sp.]
MKDKIHYIIETALFIAVVVLFVIAFSGKGKSSAVDDKATEGLIEEQPLKMAYIDIDSLMTNYTYSIDLNEQIAKKYENSRANLTERMRRLQADADEFKRKYETGSFLSAERAQAEQQRILKKQDELQKYEQEISQDLAAEQNRLNQDLRNTIITQLKLYNRNKNYKIIYGKLNDNILYADDSFNITAEVIDFLNKQHQASPLAKPE